MSKTIQKIQSFLSLRKPSNQDDEKFISDCINSGMNNYEHPLQYASKRIQKLYE